LKKKSLVPRGILGFILFLQFFFLNFWQIFPLNTFFVQLYTIFPKKLQAIIHHTKNLVVEDFILFLLRRQGQSEGAPLDVVVGGMERVCF
jgi:hypothetical protein